MASKVIYAPPDLSELSKKYFVADIHFHTMYSHDCNTPVSQVLDRVEELGIHVAITDHNRIGGVLEAHKTERGRRLVIPGIEVTTKEGKDVLIYFYRLGDLKSFYRRKIEQHMKQKASIRSNRTQYSLHDLLPDLQGENCVVVLPHPVGAKTRASYGYLQRAKNHHLVKYLDAIEAINETMTHRANLTTLGWALQLGKPVTAGSDGHRIKRLGEAVTMAHAKTKDEFLDAIKQGKTMVVGKEMKLLERVGLSVSLLREKAKVRSNRRIDGS